MTTLEDFHDFVGWAKDDNDFKKDFKKEIEVYGNNSSDYSYVYYIMKKEVRQ